MAKSQTKTAAQAATTTDENINTVEQVITTAQEQPAEELTVDNTDGVEAMELGVEPEDTAEIHPEAAESAEQAELKQLAADLEALDHPASDEITDEVTEPQVEPEGEPVVVVPVATGIQAVDLSMCTTESSRIRSLHRLGYSKGDIARELGRRRNRPMKFQHVRNVLATPVKNERL
jgi:hypothetical protein